MRIGGENGSMLDKNFSAKWSKSLADGRLECLLCPRHCRLREGQRGFCFIRKRCEGQLVNTAYRASLGFHIDPIEKKPLNHFYPGTTALSFGTPGCNLGCLFCQNWHLSRAQEAHSGGSNVKPAHIAQAALMNGCRSLAFTYNDPIIWADFALETAEACRELGIKTVAVSNGYMEPEPRRLFYEYIDAANIDLKAFNEDFYRRYCLAHLQPVLDTLVYIKHRTSTWLELTTLIIPELNDSPQEMRRQCSWIVRELGADVPLHLSAFHPSFRLSDRPATPTETLINLRQIALECGLLYVYTGNIHAPETQATYCPKCGEMLIERQFYEVDERALNKGVCQRCGTQIAGRF